MFSCDFLDACGKKILSACDTYFHATALVPVAMPLEKNFSEITYLKKTIDRLTEFSHQTGTDLQCPWLLNNMRTPSLLSITHEAAQAVMARSPAPSFIHGDFCFSNIFFDFRSGRLKVVDPRGLDAQGRITPYGDFRYEIGKLAHSVIGLYDHIVAGHFSMSMDHHSIRFKVLADKSMPLQKFFSNRRSEAAPRNNGIATL